MDKKPYIPPEFRPYFTVGEYVAIALGTAAVIALAFLSLCLAGCNQEDLETTAYKTLRVSATSYDAAMKSAVDLYTDGHIDDDQLNAVIDAATKYRAAYLTCVALLTAYHEATDPTRPDADHIRTTVAACTGALVDLIGIVTEYRGYQTHEGHEQQ